MASAANDHVLLVSFPGQGHVTPLLRLGKLLASKGFLVTFSTTETLGQQMRTAGNVPYDGTPTPVGDGWIRFEFFDHGLDDETDPKPFDFDHYLLQLELNGRRSLTRMIGKHAGEGRPVSCIINNPFVPWVSDVADSLGIPSALLWVQSCACFSAYYHYSNGLIPFPSENQPQIDVQLPCMPLLKHDEIPSFLHPNTPFQALRRAILGQFKNLTKPFCILMETFQELEPEVIDYMSSLYPIKPVGPLFKNPNAPEPGLRGDLVKTDDGCIIDWLDSNPPESVVYISFGSIVYPNQSQIDEIAYGILESEVRFLWVMKPPPPKELGFEPVGLPEGFLEKVGERGRVVQWCPQEDVLAHPAVVCFVTHCGWNSTMEALGNGVPVGAFPRWGDQVTNAVYLVDVFGVGIGMCRGEAEGRIVPREEIEKCLREATSGGPKAADMKKKALRWKETAQEAVAEGGSSDRNLKSFVDEVRRRRGLDHRVNK